MKVTTFQINVSQETLDDLRKRLSGTRWTEGIKGEGWDYGTNPAYLRELCAYWQNEFNWRKQEAELNSFNHFRADLDGFGIHFIHERGKGKDPLPIILTHGYPDSFVRFLIPIPNYAKQAREKIVTNPVRRLPHRRLRNLVSFR